MASDDRSVFEGLSPIFTVRDIPEALAFYTEKLEFEIGWTWGEPATYASVCRDRVELNLGLPAADKQATSSAVYVSLTRIDDYHARLLARGVAVTVPIDDRDYGMRDFTSPIRAGTS